MTELVLTKPSLKKLCPSCDGETLRVYTHTVISYDVSIDANTEELFVFDEQVDDSGWSAESPVECLRCKWLGRVADCLD